MIYDQLLIEVDENDLNMCIINYYEFDKQVIRHSSQIRVGFDFTNKNQLRSVGRQLTQLT
jgi:hypothetical protein